MLIRIGGYELAGFAVKIAMKFKCASVRSKMFSLFGDFVSRIQQNLKDIAPC